MARGGKRQGAPGRSYSNRTDMNQAIKVAPGQPYGQAQALENAQRVIPLPNNAAVPPAGPAQPAPTGGAVASPMDFTRPTERPDEPVTSGISSGPGPGPEAIGGGPDLIGAQLRALYQQAPNNDLLRLIELHDRGF